VALEAALLEQVRDCFQVQQGLQIKDLQVAREPLQAPVTQGCTPLVAVEVAELLVATQLQAQTAVRAVMGFLRLSQELLWQEAAVAVELRA
jgi:hypothetical protein